MTRRTTSATRVSVVSKSSEVANTSATSSSRSSTGRRFGLETTEFTLVMIAAGLSTICNRKSRRRERSGILKRTHARRLFSWYNADVSQISILLRVIQAIADHKFVGNLESDVITFEWQFSTGGLTQQSGNFQRLRLTSHQHLFQIRSEERRVGKEWRWRWQP